MNSEAYVRRIYRRLAVAWGAQNWWPAQSRFEVIVGAYLTQNTSWSNVELAMANLRGARVLSVDGVRTIAVEDLEILIRSAGYFRQKAQRLKTFITYLDAKYSGSLDRMFDEPTGKLREELLALNGIGPETADSILLYAGNHPVFVVDAYTRRILDRHSILPFKADYEEIRALFQRALVEVGAGASEQRNGVQGVAHKPSRMSLAKRTAAVQVLNEMHALIVGVGKNHCFNKNPDCASCPLKPLLPKTPDYNGNALGRRRNDR